MITQEKVLQDENWHHSPSTLVSSPTIFIISWTALRWYIYAYKRFIRQQYLQLFITYYTWHRFIRFQFKFTVLKRYNLNSFGIHFGHDSWPQFRQEASCRDNRKYNNNRKHESLIKVVTYYKINPFYLSNNNLTSHLYLTMPIIYWIPQRMSRLMTP